MNSIFKNATILITGGTGSWGQELTRQLLQFNPARIIIFSRGEIKQVEMQRKFNDRRLQFVIGDVRDKHAVNDLFMQPVDYVYHLAALKHVPICENQPDEAVHTNIYGISNVINAVIRAGNVQKFILVSTDKAVDPVNVYGNTKAIAEKMTLLANTRTATTEFLCVRGGNVLGTNGSLVPHLIAQIKDTNTVTITDSRMTRYFMDLPTAISLLFFATEHGIGGETYVMNMPSFYITDVAWVLIDKYGSNSTQIREIGAREGEKLHECLISQHEVPRTHYINSDYHVIYPAMNVNRTNFHYWGVPNFETLIPPDARFTSADNLHDMQCLTELLTKGGYLK